MITVPAIAVVCLALLAMAVGVVTGWLLRRPRHPDFCVICARKLIAFRRLCWRHRTEARPGDRWSEWN